MMLDEYLNSGSEGFPQTRTNGIPSDWMPVCSITVSHGKLWAGDPFICDSDDGCMVDVSNGEYTVEAQGYDFDGVRIIGRTRVRLISESNPELGPLAGETGTDSALIAICDMGSLDAAVGSDDDGFQSIIDGHDFQRFGLLQFQMDGEINIAYVNSGFGDGTGPMYKLMSHDNCVGIELDFICEDRS